MQSLSGKMYRIGTWVQVLTNTDARIFCGIGEISDTSIGIRTTLVSSNSRDLKAHIEYN